MGGKDLMGLITKNVWVTLNSTNMSHYENLGYKVPKKMDEHGRFRTPRGTEIYVNIKDLSKASHVKVDVQCDECKRVSSVIWNNYGRYSKDDNTYFCVKCSKKLYGDKKTLRTKLINGKSFEQWCIENERKDILKRWDCKLNKCLPKDILRSTNKKYWFMCPRKIHKSELNSINSFTNGSLGAMDCLQCSSFEQWCIDNNERDALDRWDYELNNCNPIDIPFSTRTHYYFKCPNHIHKSELKNVNSFTNKNKSSILTCKACNSFAQWGINKFGLSFLKDYWDDEKNIVSPWELAKCSRIRVWIKCQEKMYHGSYQTECNSFTYGHTCPYCGGHKVHPLDSLGKILEDKNLLDLWSYKNKKSPYKYTPYSSKNVWWKCPDGKHDDFLRKISASNRYKFRCPECQYSKGEERISNYFYSKKISFESQQAFDGLVGLKGGALTYDFYLPNHNLLIEYQGEQHERYIKVFYKSKQDFKKQLEHDRRKREYALTNNINLKEIWYYDFDNIEKILDTYFY
jgi:hypothetical protein